VRTQGRRAAILAGGRLTGVAEARRVVRAAGLLICADGGLRAARRLGVRPHVAIGDFDSASADLRAWAVRAGARIVAHPVEKDETDTELALDYAIAAGARAIDFLGALGGRLDHELANVALLLRARAAGVFMAIREGRTIAFLAPRRSPLPAAPGDTVSLLPVSWRVTGITTSGLFYPLRRATLARGSTRGISNHVTSPRPAIAHAVGDLLVIVTRRRGTGSAGGS
jgi:thiamine pyrophosphokinase